MRNRQDAARKVGKPRSSLPVRRPQVSLSHRTDAGAPRGRSRPRADRPAGTRPTRPAHTAGAAGRLREPGHPPTSSAVPSAHRPGRPHRSTVRSRDTFPVIAPVPSDPAGHIPSTRCRHDRVGPDVPRGLFRCSSNAAIHRRAGLHSRPHAGSAPALRRNGERNLIDLATCKHFGSIKYLVESQYGGKRCVA